jgi:hypothetical protein
MYGFVEWVSFLWSVVVCIHDGWMIQCMQRYMTSFVGDVCGCDSMYVYNAQIMVGAERRR